VIGLFVAVILNVDAVGAARELYRDEALRTAVAEQAVSVTAKCQDESPAAIQQCTREAVRGVDGSIRLPVGWAGKSISDVDVWQVLGWLLAAVALGQGAPFWFDLLRKSGRLRD
jgi:hypothetical protein